MMHQMMSRQGMIAIVLAAALIAACGGNNEENNSSSNNDPMMDDMGMNGGDDMDPDLSDNNDEVDQGDNNDDPDLGDNNDDTDMDTTGGDTVAETEPNDLIDVEQGIDQSNAFTLGDTLTGNVRAYDGSEAQEADIDFFSFDALAGSVVTVDVTDVGAGVSDQGLFVGVVSADTESSIDRGLDTTITTSREVFIPEDGRYYLVVFDNISIIQDEDTPIPAHGGEDATYTIGVTAAAAISTSSITAPTTEMGDLSDGLLDIYGLTWSSTNALTAETIALRDPVASEVDTVLYLWDVAAAEIIAINDDIDAGEGVFDSRLIADAQMGTEYLLIVDFYDAASSGSYTLEIGEQDDSVDVPNDIALDTPLTGVIADADADAEEFDTDYYAISLAPGSAITVTVTSEGTMQPFVAAFGGGTFVQGSPNDGIAAQTISAPTTLDSDVEVTLFVDDARNIPEDDADTPEYVGGSDFEYTIEVTEYTPSPMAETFPLDASTTIPAPGGFVWYELSVSPNTIVSLSAQTNVTDATPAIFEYTDTQAIDTNGGAAAAVVPAGQTTRVFGVGDFFGWGTTAQTTYDVTISAREFDLSQISFNVIEEPANNETEATAAPLTLPVEVKAVTQATDVQNPTFDYYSVDATAGQTIIAQTTINPDATQDDPNDPLSGNADTIVRILDPQGQVIAGNDDALGGDIDTFSAVAADAPTDGSYTIVVEPYLNRQLMEYDNGAYLLRVLKQ